MKRKTSRKDFNSVKESFIRLRDKILAASPELQQKALSLMSELIENLEDKQLKDFFTAYLDIIRDLIQTEANSNEK